MVVELQRVLVDRLNFRQHRPRNFRVSSGRDSIGVKLGHFVGALHEDAGEGRHHLVPVPVADEPVEDQLVGQDLGRVAAAQGTRYLKKIEAQVNSRVRNQIAGLQFIYGGSAMATTSNIVEVCKQP